jgi:hypothetical protein
MSGIYNNSAEDSFRESQLNDYLRQSSKDESESEIDEEKIKRTITIEETIDRIQPFLDEYTMCEIKKLQIIKRCNEAKRAFDIGEMKQVKELIIFQSDTEKKIMQILLDSNKETVKKTIQL